MWIFFHNKSCKAKQSDTSDVRSSNFLQNYVKITYHAVLFFLLYNIYDILKIKKIVSYLIHTSTSMCFLLNLIRVFVVKKKSFSYKGLPEWMSKIQKKWGKTIEKSFTPRENSFIKNAFFQRNNKNINTIIYIIVYHRANL